MNEQRPDTITINHRGKTRTIPKDDEGQRMNRPSEPVTPYVQPQPVQAYKVPKAQEIVKGTQKDRAEAFVIRFRPIAQITGIALGVIFLLGRIALNGLSGLGLLGGLGLLTGAIFVGLGAFLFVWLIALFIDAVLSPVFIQLYESTQEQRRLNQAHKEQIRAYRKREGLE